MVRMQGMRSVLLDQDTRLIHIVVHIAGDVAAFFHQKHPVSAFSRQMGDHSAGKAAARDDQIILQECPPCFLRQATVRRSPSSKFIRQVKPSSRLSLPVFATIISPG